MRALAAWASGIPDRREGPTPLAGIPDALRHSGVRTGRNLSAATKVPSSIPERGPEPRVATPSLEAFLEFGRGRNQNLLTKSGKQSYNTHPKIQFPNSC